MTAALCSEIHPGGARCGGDAGHTGNHFPRNDHHCHARGCTVATKPEMLMCLRHWRMVPRHIQRKVWATYRPGQCDDKNVSRPWLTAADEAIAAVAEKEARR